MAKKSKSGKIDIASLGFGILGAAVAGKIAGINLPVNDKLKPFIPVVAGVALMMTKNAQAKAAGLGMAVYAGTRAIAANVPALGLGGDSSMGDYMIEGPDYALAGPDSDGTMIGAATETGSSYALAGVDELTNDDFVG